MMRLAEFVSRLGLRLLDTGVFDGFSHGSLCHCEFIAAEECIPAGNDDQQTVALVENLVRASPTSFSREAPRPNQSYLSLASVGECWYLA
jgi:hypothetical protein